MRLAEQLIEIVIHDLRKIEEGENGAQGHIQRFSKEKGSFM